MRTYAVGFPTYFRHQMESKQIEYAQVWLISLLPQNVNLWWKFFIRTHTCILRINEQCFLLYCFMIFLCCCFVRIYIQLQIGYWVPMKISHPSSSSPRQALFFRLFNLCLRTSWKKDSRRVSEAQKNTVRHQLNLHT